MQNAWINILHILGFIYHFLYVCVFSSLFVSFSFFLSFIRTESVLLCANYIIINYFQVFFILHFFHLFALYFLRSFVRSFSPTNIYYTIFMRVLLHSIHTQNNICFLFLFFTIIVFIYLDDVMVYYFHFILLNQQDQLIIVKMLLI